MTSPHLSSQMDLVKLLAAHSSTPIVMVLVNGGPIDVSWAISSPRVVAVIEAWYPGQLGSRAIADVLFGVVSPSGRMPVTVRQQWCSLYVSYRASAIDE
jgi:beta-glucosidase